MVGDYISREAALTVVERLRDKCGNDEMAFALNWASGLLRNVPAADVVEVVRCGKCKYGKYTGTEWFCDKHSGHADRFGEEASYHEYHSKYWFCADGERRDGGQDE